LYKVAENQLCVTEKERQHFSPTPLLNEFVAKNEVATAPQAKEVAMVHRSTTQPLV
jgi:hypothetical protein